MTGTSSSYVLDDASPVTFTSPDQTSVEDTHHYLFYSSPALQDGAHILTITQLTNSSRQVLWLDYFVYQPSPPSTTSALPASTSAIHSPTTCNASKSAGVNIAAMLGSIGGGLLAGLLLSAFIYALLRRRRRSAWSTKTNILAGSDIA